MFNTEVQARLVLMPSANGSTAQVRVIAQGHKFIVTDDALWLEDENVLRDVKRVKVATFDRDASLVTREAQVRANARSYFPQIVARDIAEVSRYFFPDEA